MAGQENSCKDSVKVINEDTEKVKYSVEEILQLRDSPLSQRKLKLPEWFLYQAAKKEHGKKTENKQEKTPPTHPVMLPQMRLMPAPRSFSAPIYTYPGRPILGRSDTDVPEVEIQRAMMDMSLEPSRRISVPMLSPRPGNHFHQRRTVPWDPLPYQPFVAAPAHLSWPVPYIKSFGVTHKNFPENGAFCSSPCYY